jgi:tellurite resistance protein TerC
MFFLLADMADRFHLLKYGLAVVLSFIGTKMLIVDFYKIPIGPALGAVAFILLASVALSIYTSGRDKPASPPTSHH